MNQFTSLATSAPSWSRREHQWSIISSIISSIKKCNHCSNQNFHGHNYELIVSLTGKVDPETGYVYDMGKLKNIIKSEIEDYLDHKNLNLDIEEFSTLNPSAENIAILIYNKLIKYFEKNYKLKITLFETPRNFVEYSG